MAVRIMVLLLLVALVSTSILYIGCSSQGEEAQPYGPPQVHFPEDEGAHSEAGVEWWYLNSLLTDSNAIPR